jgi:hypothetical protein
MAGENEEAKVIVVSDPKLYEYLYSVIQDAQASGAVVHIVTILPTTIVSPNGIIEPLGCNPKATTCPK